MLLLAAAINWIVAWTCALWMPRRDWRMRVYASPDDPRPSRAAGWMRLDVIEDPSIWERGDDWRREVRLTGESGIGVWIVSLELEKQWPMRRGSGITKVARVMVVESGWPWAGLWAVHVFMNPDPRQVYPEENARWPGTATDSEANWRGALQAPEFLNGRPVEWRGGGLWSPLPYRVRWVAFGGSTLFWLGVLAGPGILWRAGRRVVRRRRGRCGWCGYDIRGLTRCPECGAGSHRPSLPPAA